MQRELADLQCAPSKPQSMQFASAEGVSLRDLSSRNNVTTKAVKGMKIPKHVLDQRLVKQVEFGKFNFLNFK